MSSSRAFSIAYLKRIFASFFSSGGLLGGADRPDEEGPTFEVLDSSADTVDMAVEGYLLPLRNRAPRSSKGRGGLRRGTLPGSAGPLRVGSLAGSTRSAPSGGDSRGGGVFSVAETLQLQRSRGRPRTDGSGPFERPSIISDEIVKLKHLPSGQVLRFRGEKRSPRPLRRRRGSRRVLSSDDEEDFAPHVRAPGPLTLRCRRGLTMSLCS